VTLYDAGSMPAPTAAELRRDFLKVLVLPALTFLLIPLLSLGFVRYGTGRIDGDILEAIEHAIDKDASLAEPDRAALKAEWRAHPPSTLCEGADPELAAFRAKLCAPSGDLWQFRWAGRTALLATLLGVATFAAIGLLGLVAFWSRSTQYWSFVLGRRVLVAVTAIETVLQGGLAVWLSYWGTALFFNSYVPKLIILVAILAGLAVIVIVKALFKKPAEPDALEAEPLAEADAPGLWRRVRELAAQLGAEPPGTILAGIDDNFFVTEQPTRLASDGEAKGRTLYLSLPLLRTLAPVEAEAIFGHELAHFHGGDTAASARLAPALIRYEAYADTLAEGGITIPAAHVMRLFRAIFELALARERRSRELRADAAAARLTSPADLARSLLKVTGYSSFRARTERQLFEQRTGHQEGLALRSRIDGGLAGYAASPGFAEDLAHHDVPHPFDTHPPIAERIAAVGAAVRPEDAAALLQEPLARTWADEVLTGPAVEERLWGAYEARFQADHQASLAWRYRPANDEERAHVLRYFPDVEYPQKGTLRLTYQGLRQPDGEEALFSELLGAKVDDGTFSKQLVLTLRGPDGAKRKVKVNLKALGKRAGAFQGDFARYWQRDQVARQAA